MAERESYGYELVSSIQALGLSEVREGSVYPALSRLERDGHIRSRLVRSNAGPARKYYAPSARGYALLAEIEAAWKTLVRALDPLVRARVPDSPKEALL